MTKNNKLKLIEKTIKILESPNYKKYSQSKAKNYIEYMSLDKIIADEKRLIQPILFPKFLEEILEYTKGENIYCEEGDKSGNYPDFVPTDRITHPWIFDTKGTDTKDLHNHLKQIRRYIESYQIKYGILINMRDVDVYSIDNKEEIELFNFNFVTLYKEYKESTDKILESQNTKKFLNFISSFNHQDITRDKKLELLAEMSDWTGLEYLNTDNLTIALRKITEWLYLDIRNRKKEFLFTINLSNDKERKQQIFNELIKTYEEIGSLTNDLEKYTIEYFINDENPSSNFFKATNVYFYRTAYFCLTRILLARMWGDIGFIERNVLYNGDFKKCYGYVNKKINEVLSWAFNLAGKKYSWLFLNENNYSWYTPSEDVLIDSLYELADFPIGKLDKDILGTIYENYVELIDKKNKGQYYTPHPIVELIWDFIGYNSPEAFFTYEKNRRVIKKVLDIATGSGSFLVEAISRLRNFSGINMNDFKDVIDLRTAIINGFYGLDISPFAYYISEVNLLIQLTPIIKRMLELNPKISEYPYCLSVIQNDSLQLHNQDRYEILKFEDITEKNKKKKNLYQQAHNIIIDKDKAKQKIFETIKNSKDFYYCCSNPPYVREDDHKDLFRKTKELYPYWEKYYQGKMDYLYWFIILGLSKLIEGGKLGFITTSYWLEAQGAEKLRDYIFKNAQILYLIDFGKTKLFEHALGQFNIVFILEKTKKKDSKIKIIKVLKSFDEKNAKNNIKKIKDHIIKNYKNDYYKDNFIEIFWSAVEQKELSNKKWHIKIKEDSNKIIKKMSKFSKLIDFCEIRQGIVSGADTVNANNIKLLTSETIQKYSIKEGQGIFYLTEREKRELNLPDNESNIIKKLYKASDIEKYNYCKSNLYIIYTNKNTKIDNFPKIKEHLIKYKQIIDTLRINNETNLPYYSLHRPRNINIFKNEKIVCSIWPKENIFAYSNTEMYFERNVFILNKKNNIDEDLKYILGILNSKIINYWFSKKISKRGDKYFLPKNDIEKIPIPKIDFLNNIKLELYNKIVNDVDMIIKYKRNLKDVRNKYSKNIEKCNLRQHPHVVISSNEINNFIFKSSNIKRVSLLEESSLIIYGKNKEEIIIKSHKVEFLEYINNHLNEYIGKTWNEIKENLLIPLSLKEYLNYENKIIEESKIINNIIGNLQEKIDKITFKLYELTKDEIKIIENS